MARPDGKFKVQVTWLGRAAFKIISPEGKIIYIDPWLKDNPLCPAEYKDVSKLKADIICFTHTHGDHLGDTVELAKLTGAKVVVMVDLSQGLVQQGLDANQLIRLSYGGTDDVAGVKASLVPAWHIPSAAGVVLGFSSGFKLYHAGDTCLFLDMSLIKTLYSPQLVLLPVGGIFTMDDYAASLACREYIQPQFAIPMHYPARSIASASTECADNFKKHLQGSKTEVIILKPGETVNF
jgi:L-ascorbate metabolism protein UlaG (beta-lactamase superfamily)